MRIDVIVNTTARRFARSPGLVDRLHRTCAGVAEVHSTASLGALDAVAGEIAARGSDLVILSGGDGTFMAGLTALARATGEDRLPPLALLPGGTVATVARNWGMVGEPLALLEGLLRRRDALRFVPRPTLRVVGETGHEGGHPHTPGDRTEQRLGFIFGTGL